MKNEIERMVNYMRKMKTIIFAVLFSIMFVAICGGFSQTIQAKSVVEKRLEAVRKEFPQNSFIHASVNVNGTRPQRKYISTNWADYINKKYCKNEKTV